MNYFFEPESPDDQVTLEGNVQLAELEKAGLDVIHGLERLGETYPREAAQSLRKLWAVSQSKAQTLSLRPVVMKRKVTL